LELAEQVLGKAKEFGGNRAYSLEDVKTRKAASKGKSDVKYLQEKMERLNKRANQGLIEAIFAFAKTIELKDHYTGEHVERTVYFATRLAEGRGLTKEEVLHIKQAAILHDLGKVGISERILLKPAKLTVQEFKEIKKHPLIGVDIIRPIHLLHDIVPLIMYHHERWDGKGYPEGLKGEEIPMGARIIALADTYQALISNRPYRKAFPKTEAKDIIKRMAGSQFDPGLVKIFLKII
jgi:HD-GYP domain-containing protein (c-di-GMP phosphodiesterase class II)